MRPLVAFLALLLPLLLGMSLGYGIGQAGKRKALHKMRESIKPIVSAARSLADANLVDTPHNRTLATGILQDAVRQYDESERRRGLPS